MSFPIDVSLPDNGGAWRIRTVEDFRELVEREVAAWSWVGPEIQRSGNPREALNGLVLRWNAFRKQLATLKALLDQGNGGQAAEQLLQYYTGRDAFPMSTSARGLLVLGAVGDNTSRAGLGALATLLKVKIDGDDPEQLRGVLLAHEFAEGTGKAARRSVQASLSGLLQRLSSQQLKLEERADAFDARVETLDRRRHKQFDRLVAAGSAARKAFATDIDARLVTLAEESHARSKEIRAAAKAAEDSIRSTEKVYSEHMALQGPVTYWRKKAKEHKTKSLIAAGVGLAYAAALVWYAFDTGALLVIDIVKSAVEETKQWQVAYVVLAVVVFLLTIAFWIGRLISRTYVSHAHLVLDAEERATMVQTYLALANEDKIKDAERILVLGALFRSSSDGLVRDDASPDISPAGLVSKFGAGAGPQRG